MVLELVTKFVDIILHLDKYLSAIVQQYGTRSVRTGRLLVREPVPGSRWATCDDEAPATLLVTAELGGNCEQGG